MIAAGAIGDNILDFLIPIIAMVVYFIASMRKKKNPTPPLHEEEEEADVREEPLPPLPRAAKTVQTSDLPPIRRKAPELYSQIEERKIESTINQREYSTSITEKRSSDLISSEMRKHIDLDHIYAEKAKSKASRARKLFSDKSSVRKAFLLQEILKRQ
jgi:hypothetical protein